MKKGQIAHLNGKRTDHRVDNLVWLCLHHHDEFDSRTSQSKNFTPAEVRHYRDKLVDEFARLSAVEQTSLPDEKEVEESWRFPSWLSNEAPQLFPYRALNRVDGVCVIEAIKLPDGRVVVACIAVPGNPGSSITNNVEAICDQVCRQLELDPETLVWLENYEYINPREWMLVTFGSKPPAEWGDPKWRKMTPRLWAGLGLKPVENLRVADGELLSKLRRV